MSKLFEGAEMTEREMLAARVISAACAWWHRLAPVDLSYEEHLECPWMNTITAEDEILSKAIVSFLKFTGTKP